MKVKVPLIGSGTENDPYRPDVRFIRSITDPNTGETITKTSEIGFELIDYSIDEKWAIIKIDPNDYDKIKDKVIEIIEQ